ncbi:hypothetical protein CJ030_MR7G009237 [Morella rubra]|uniref:Uncharacterized protein n=1 Tax=Morella rubra TaxID=262757 RepID=A0A6A1V1U8_9ROSI|nr:hypothetical protein CJ030_MR7G009237 [Morella rubra]
MLGDDTSILDGAYMVHGQLRPFWRIMHLILCSAIDPRKHTMELSYSRAEFLYLVVVWGLPVDMASYIYQSIRAEALKTDAIIHCCRDSTDPIPHSLLVPEGANEPRAVPVGSINKTMLSNHCPDTLSTECRSGC